MNKFVLTLLLFAVLISGCTEEDMTDAILGDIPMIGWFTGSASDDSANVDAVDKLNPINVKTPDINTSRCPKNQYWDYRYGVCMCEADYYMQDNVCVPKDSRQCVVDRDCSPDGRLSKCDNTYVKRMYYCDLNTYKCVGGKGVGTSVDCRTEYGNTYQCYNGNCVVPIAK